MIGWIQSFFSLEDGPREIGFTMGDFLGSSAPGQNPENMELQGVK